ncbi:MBL fold metallo-hydrolase [Xanthomonas sp. WHRI 10064A]|uniref:MBL fold metallo-hydrolase n=1 Tax=unclassified Xanthomonas TaxID=2643310 RepID=UPI002B23B1CF|nr:MULTISPECIES: MBL fold metallo-hydrolase [unclassified Xanthomonas]MEA9585852.1 MBL fold metallo-hydrolase [Xanthomonas sp. WHRI 10064B]MEA9614279.1 MBL fold metallo-hydrolase [Xanthomonas sp. WHRI 10064A]
MKLPSLALATVLALGIQTSANAAVPASPTTSIQQIRNATAKITYGDTVLLVDPMLTAKGAYPGFPDTYRSELRNPTVDLPFDVGQVLKDVDAVLLTHTHLDHWDPAAETLIPRQMPMFVQHEADAALLRGKGFADVRILPAHATFGGVKISRIADQHGTAAMFQVEPLAKLLGSVTGFVFEKAGEPTIYLAGDTVWTDDVQDAIKRYTPDVIVLNTGDARIKGFDAGIIMGVADTSRVHALAPKAKIVAVHMDAVNHMTVSRADLRRYVNEKAIQDSVLIPEDGETLNF